MIEEPLPIAKSRFIVVIANALPTIFAVNRLIKTECLLQVVRMEQNLFDKRFNITYGTQYHNASKLYDLQCLVESYSWASYIFKLIVMEKNTMGKLCVTLLGGLFWFVASSNILADSDNKPVGITPEIMSIPVNVGGETVEFKRNQDNAATVNPAFAKTSRPCPPFCIQPSNLAFGVETIGEVELMHFAKDMNEGNEEILVIDSRTPDWVERGTIPTAMNVPWTNLNPAKGATPLEIADILETVFNVSESEGLFDFSGCRTVVMFCNGMWCGQSPNNIKNLLRLGYPPNKIKWYRGGMQDWEILGLTTVKPN